MIRIVKLLENVVEWRRKLAGKLQKYAGSEPVRIGKRGSDRICELTKGIRTGLELVAGEGLAKRKAVHLELGWTRGSDRSKLGSGADRTEVKRSDRIGVEETRELIEEGA